MNGATIDQIARAELKTVRAYGISNADRDDMLQEARIKVWKTSIRVEEANPDHPGARAYLGMAARSAAIEFLRWRGRRVRPETSLEVVKVVPRYDGEVECMVLDREQREDLLRILFVADLTPREMEVILDRLGIERSAAVEAMEFRTRSRHLVSARKKIQTIVAVER